MKQRFSGRAADQLRPISITYNVLEYTAGSVLFQIGRTKLICAITLQNNVPAFLKGKKTGWLQAEYAMLPAATHVRKEREVVGCKRNGRSVEISRLIARSLRSIVDLTALGERTITIDCDVIQADGGTRTAAISGAYAALRVAIDRWLRQGILQKDILKESIAAVSVGVTSGGLLLDLDYAEDNDIIADFNFVLTASGLLVEVQGTAEQAPIDWSLMHSMYVMALKGVKEIFVLTHNDRQLSPVEVSNSSKPPFNSINFRQPRKSENSCG